MGDGDAGTLEAELASRLGMDLPQFLDLFGAGWAGAEPAGGVAWYVAGDPPQLMIALDDGELRLARPRGQRTGAGRLELTPVDERVVSVLRLFWQDQARLHVGDLLHRRRSGFRYCALCRRVTAPEACHDQACMECAQRWLGAAY